MTMCAFIVRQYYLILAKWQWISVAMKVTAGLAESDGIDSLFD